VLIITALALLAGCIAGFAWGGRLRRIADVSLSSGALVFVAVAIMVVQSLVDLGEATDRALLALGYGLVAAFIVLNVRRSTGLLRAALSVLAIGWTLNAVVMLPNGGMPLSRAAYAASGQTETPTPGEGGFFKVVLADDETVLRPLGDVIPISPVHQVISAGDIVLMLGLAGCIAAAMQHTASPAGPRSARRRAARAVTVPSAPAS
jgi:hypothetical protein